MLRTKTLLAALALPLVASCTNPEKQTAEPVQAQVDADAQELDPNDPNVMVCPVTGAMQLKTDADAGAMGMRDHGGEHGADHGAGHDEN